MSDLNQRGPHVRAGGQPLHARPVSRRTLLRGAVLGGAFAAMPNLLAACGASGDESGGGGETATLGWGTTGIRALDYARSFDTQTGVPLAISL
nr:hypothetical protein [Actinomycetota bacterium]